MGQIARGHAALLAVGVVAGGDHESPDHDLNSRHYQPIIVELVRGVHHPRGVDPR